MLPPLERAPGEADGAQAMGLGVTGVELDGAVHQDERLPGARLRVLAVEEHRPDKVLPGVQALGRLPLQALVLGSVDVRLDTPDHALGNLVLDGEDIVERPVVALRPEVSAALRLDELPGDPDPVAALPHATLEDVADPKLAADLADVHVAALVGEARVPSDHEQPS
jgi:hypothetical protein